MAYQDRTIKCATCGREFLFTAKEQEFFLNKGFKEPRHCRECRQQRKQDRDQALAQMTGQTVHTGREAFKVVCANCHRETTVPFRPTTGKPVLCKDCFIAQRFGASLLGIEKPIADNPPSEATSLADSSPARLHSEPEESLDQPKLVQSVPLLTMPEAATAEPEANSADYSIAAKKAE